MSTAQRLTLIGLSNYNPNLFDGLTLPEGYDKDTFINSLLLEHGEKCVLYSNPDFMGNAITLWGRKWELELKRIYEALIAEYDPISNYDRYEEITDSDGRKYTSEVNAGHKAIDKPDYSDTQTNDNTDKTTNDYKIVTDTNEDATTEHKVSADNSGSYQPDWKETTNGGKSTQSNDGTITDVHTGTVKHDIAGTTQNLDETSNSKTTDSETHNYTHKAHIWGNIGVTTATQMSTEILRQRFKFNLYGVACRLFANELLIGIY